MITATLAGVLACSLACAGDSVSTQSLLEELADPSAIARFPVPAFTLRQASSYDRASVQPSDAERWFANNDFGQFLRVEERDGRTESVMMDAQGPGAVVRIWSPNPKGVLRIYLDDAVEPAISAPMAGVLDGTALLGGVAQGPPLAGSRSRGWNLFLPIPFAKRCVMTTDDGKGVYYQVNWRAYAAGTSVQTFTRSDLPGVVSTAGALATLSVPEVAFLVPPVELAAGQRVEILNDTGRSGHVNQIVLQVEASGGEAMSTLVLEATFDGQLCVQCPLAALCSWAPGGSTADARRAVRVQGAGRTDFLIAWPMPFQRAATLAVRNAGKERMRLSSAVRVEEWIWDDRSMHFHANWRRERSLHTRPMRDFRYLTATGVGVYAGDSLHVVNPVDAWWGEGDEKISVDGEAFPSHFGTGTEDYYGYGWCSPQPFTHPLHSQNLCDGREFNTNWGRTIVTRLRGLDSIPFTKDLRVDMEVWHWAECDISYAPAVFWYGRPGAACHETLDADEVAKGDPARPPVYRIPGALECELLRVAERSKDLEYGMQGMRSFGMNAFSADRHLWVRATKPGDFIQLAVPAPAGAQRVTLYATKSWDYGTVQCAVNGVDAGAPIDLCSMQEGRAVPTGAIDLGVHQPVNGLLMLRVTVVGSNPKSTGSRSYFGLDAVTLKPAE